MCYSLLLQILIQVFGDVLTLNMLNLLNEQVYLPLLKQSLIIFMDMNISILSRSANSIEPCQPCTSWSTLYTGDKGLSYLLPPG